MKNNILKFNECANCGACYNICPTKAITIEAHDLFYCLEVSKDKCIDCGRCVSICPVNNFVKSQNLISAIGAYSKDKSTIKKSSSGGIFYELARYILANNGVVFGAAFSEDFKKVYIKSTDEVTIDELLRSKYVESQVGDSFIKVKQNLEDNRMVLFCGCPCQVAGLKKFLGKDYENLYTCDFSCGGLPSHKLYEQYLNSLELKYNSKITNVNFRPKIYGWEMHAIKIEFANGKKYKSLGINDPFFSAFIYKHYSVRDNCLKCKFADNHYSDIVLADFWLYKKLSGLKGNNGLSLVITNSNKGEKLLDSIKEELIFEKIDLKGAAYNMVAPKYTAEFYNVREAFLDQCKSSNLNIAAKKFCLPNTKTKYKIIFKNKIKNIVNRLK